MATRVFLVEALVKSEDHSRRLVIGCGTGRCGTVSLAKFLNRQADVRVLHEGRTNDDVHHLIPWRGGEARLWAWLTELEGITGNAKWYGDIGPYFISYVPDIVSRYPDVRIICMERSKHDVIDSFLLKTHGRNHWYLHNGNGWEEDPEWDPSFPKYAEADKRKALALYYDFYHSMAMQYCAIYPDNFRLVLTEALNDLNGRSSIMEFIAYDGAARFDGTFRSNASRKGAMRRLRAHFTSLMRSS